jgi:SMI1 / KNR4 family (SUKH-1)
LPLKFLNHPENDGCSNEEILEMEKYYGFKFPEAYREYLSIMGKNSHYIGAYSQGFAFWNYQYIKDYSKEIIEYYNKEHGTVSQYEDSFIIIAMSDECFNFMKNGEGDNPPVYSFWSDGPGTEIFKLHDSFTAQLLKIINESYPNL